MRLLEIAILLIVLAGLIPFLIITLSTLWYFTQIPVKSVNKVENVSVGGIIWIFPLPPLLFGYGKPTLLTIGKPTLPTILGIIAYIVCIILIIVLIIYLIKYLRKREVSEYSWV